MVATADLERSRPSGLPTVIDERTSQPNRLSHTSTTVSSLLPVTVSPLKHAEIVQALRKEGAIPGSSLWAGKLLLLLLSFSFCA